MDGVSGGPFVAFGDVICTERFVLMQAHICNHRFFRAPLNLPRMFEFPHMTLAKLEWGYAERRGNATIWLPDSATGDGGLSISAVVRGLNEDLKRDATAYRLVPAHIEAYYDGNRYNITGGEARCVFRRVQASLMRQCAALGRCVCMWAEEPAHPHITFEYPEEQERWDEARGSASAIGSAASASTTASLGAVLDRLPEFRLQRLRPVFERERLTASVLPTLTEDQLKSIGVTALGDRQKVFALAAALAAEGRGEPGAGEPGASGRAE